MIKTLSFYICDVPVSPIITDTEFLAAMPEGEYPGKIEGRILSLNDADKQSIAFAKTAPTFSYESKRYRLCSTDVTGRTWLRSDGTFSSEKDDW